MTALVRLTQKASDLTQIEALALAEEAEETTAYDLQPLQVKIAPGGVGQFQIGEEMAKSFVAIAAVSQKVRGYWPAKEPGKNPPICSSRDSITGVLNASMSEADIEVAMKVQHPHPGIVALSQAGAVLPDSFECARCPLSEFGSDGRGQACKSMIRLLLIVDGYALPAIMSLPPTSNKPWSAFCSGLKGRGKHYFFVKTRFDLDKTQTPTGIAYNTVRVSLAGDLTDEEKRDVLELRDQYKHYVRAAAVEYDEYIASDGAVDATVTASKASEPDDDLPF